MCVCVSVLARMNAEDFLIYYQMRNKTVRACGPAYVEYADVLIMPVRVMRWRGANHGRLQQTTTTTTMPSSGRKC